MGRKALFDEKPKKGKGRKSRKQGDPTLPSFLRDQKSKKPFRKDKLRQLQAKGQHEQKPYRSNPYQQNKKRKQQEFDEKVSKQTTPNKKQKLNKLSGFESEDESAGSDGEARAGFKPSSDESDDEVEEGLEKMMREKSAKRSEGDDDSDDVEDTSTGPKDKIDINTTTTEKPDKSADRPEHIQLRIKDILHVLSSFRENKEEGKSRKEYLSVLFDDLCAYYDYNDFLMRQYMRLFSPAELVSFLDSCEAPRPLTLRTNTLKTRRRDLAQNLINRGVNLDPVGEWSKVGLVVYSATVPIGATVEYLAGHYLIQGAASLLPVMALAPQENERVLDMCAAPGGKTTHIGALLRNTGVLFANDLKGDRVKAIVGNLHRLGIVNSVVTCMDGRAYPKAIKGFDRVLVDAPCSGTGVASRDPTVKISKDEVDIQRLSKLQRELLVAAIDCCKVGGVVVYSTCSVLVEENEAVVDYALRKRQVKVVETGLPMGKEGLARHRHHIYHPSLKLGKRIYPHVVNMDGFFICKLRKLGAQTKTAVAEGDQQSQEPSVQDKDAQTDSSSSADEEDKEGDGAGSVKNSKSTKQNARSPSKSGKTAQNNSNKKTNSGTFKGGKRDGRLTRFKGTKQIGGKKGVMRAKGKGGKKPPRKFNKR